jgi:DNA-binding transcriptional ArsR family regulator
MKHIDAYILVTYGQKFIPELKESAVSYILNKEFETNLPSGQWKQFFTGILKPKTKYIVHALRKKGFSPAFITEQLGINATSVSYHLSRPLKSSYTNSQLLLLQNEKYQ